jgi:hypothetical protein
MKKTRDSITVQLQPHNSHHSSPPVSINFPLPYKSHVLKYYTGKIHGKGPVEANVRAEICINDWIEDGGIFMLGQKELRKQDSVLLEIVRHHLLQYGSEWKQEIQEIHDNMHDNRNMMLSSLLPSLAAKFNVNLIASQSEQRSQGQGQGPAVTSAAKDCTNDEVTIINRAEPSFAESHPKESEDKRNKIVSTGHKLPLAGAHNQSVESTMVASALSGGNDTTAQMATATAAPSASYASETTTSHAIKDNPIVQGKSAIVTAVSASSGESTTHNLEKEVSASMTLKPSENPIPLLNAATSDTNVKANSFAAWVYQQQHQQQLHQYQQHQHQHQLHQQLQHQHHQHHQIANMHPLNAMQNLHQQAMKIHGVHPYYSHQNSQHPHLAPILPQQTVLRGINIRNPVIDARHQSNDTDTPAGYPNKISPHPFYSHQNSQHPYLAPILPQETVIREINMINPVIDTRHQSKNDTDTPADSPNKILPHTLNSHQNSQHLHLAPILPQETVIREINTINPVIDTRHQSNDTDTPADSPNKEKLCPSSGDSTAAVHLASRKSLSHTKNKREEHSKPDLIKKRVLYHASDVACKKQRILRMSIIAMKKDMVDALDAFKRPSGAKTQADKRLNDEKARSVIAKLIAKKDLFIVPTSSFDWK